jgi:hypothetical protein
LFKGKYGDGELRYPWFGPHAATTFETIVLRGSNNDGFTIDSAPFRNPLYIRDQFVRDAQRTMGHHAARGAWVHLYLNGLYWGLFNPTERPDADWHASYQRSPREEFDVLRHPNGELIDGNTDAWTNALNLASAGLSTAGAYAQFRQVWDLVNFADYMLLNLFLGTTDWPHSNWYVGRRRLPGAGFTCQVWDAEEIMESVGIDIINVNKVYTPAYFYWKLRENPEWNLLFADRAHRALTNGGPLTPDRLKALFVAQATQVESAIICESARWGDAARQPAHTLEGDWLPDQRWVLDTFLPQRGPVFLQQLRNGGLYPNLVAPTFNQHGGTVSPGFEVTMFAPAGEVWFTVDGSDPRLPGGTIAPGAVKYQSPVRIDLSTTVSARALQGGGWSALHQARFQVAAVVVNEVLARNLNGIRDEANQPEDWIELYNKSSLAVDVGGLYLTDDPLQPTKWRIPPSYVVPPGGTLLIWADEDLLQGPLHCSFKLSQSGEQVLLFDLDGTTLLSELVFGPQVADVSTGWFQDGGARLVTFPDPSPNARNELSSCGARRFSALDSSQQPIALRLSGTPGLGQQVSFQIGSGPAQAPHILLLSPFAAEIPLTISPSRLLVAPPIEILAAVLTDAAGAGNLALPIPNDPSLVGAMPYFQVWGVTSTLAALGSGALEVRVCP